MANGKKNYFRHSFFARNDIKLLQLRDKIGIGFYFYFFSLLELCGEQSADELKDFYEFHDSTIRSLWGVNLKKSERVACIMASVDLLEFEKREKSFWFRIPNLAKYLGKYTNKKQPNPEIKGKERKEKKSKVKEKKNKIVIFDFETPYHNFYPRKGNGKSRGMDTLHSTIKTQDDYDLFCEALKNYSIECSELETPMQYIKLFSTFANSWRDHVEESDIVRTKKKTLELWEQAKINQKNAPMGLLEGIEDV